MNLIGKKEHEFPHILQKWDGLNTPITSLIGLETSRSLNQRITHKYYHIRDVKKMLSLLALARDPSAKPS